MSEILIAVTPEVYREALGRLGSTPPPAEEEFLSNNPYLIVVAWRWWLHHLRREHLMHPLFELEAVTVFRDGTHSAEWLNSWSWEGVDPEDRPTYFDRGNLCGFYGDLAPFGVVNLPANCPRFFYKSEPRRKGPHSRRPPCGPRPHRRWAVPH